MSYITQKETRPPMLAMPGSLLISLLVSVLGIYALVRFRPSPEYWTSLSIGGHSPLIAGVVVGGLAIGALLTRNVVRSLLISLAFLLATPGALFAVNALAGGSAPSALEFRVDAKDKVFEHSGRNGYWNHILLGRTLAGRTFRFSTYVQHIGLDEWQKAVPGSGDYVLVHEFIGFLGIPWWKIEGLRQQQHKDLGAHNP